MIDPARSWGDDIGPIKVLHAYDVKTGLKAIVVIDNVACGPSIGGCRMAVDVTEGECRRLARAMTFKNAAAGLPHGGGKSVILADPKMPVADKERLLRSFARAIGPLEEYVVGPDMGTDETCMAWCLDEIGRAVGLPEELGGIPLDELGATGYGLAVAADVAQSYCDVDLSDARVVIEGFGSVGRHAANFLSERGALVVAVADSRGMVRNSRGLDVAALSAQKLAGSSVADFPGGESASKDEILDVACEIFLPAARPDVIHESNVDRVRARLILPGANIAVTEAAEIKLHEQNIVVLPDFIANAGGVICAASEYRGESRTLAFRSIEEKIAYNTAQVLSEARDSQERPRVAALRLARQRIERAMKLRR